MVIDLSKAQRYVELHKQMQKNKFEMDATKAEMELLEEYLLDVMTDPEAAEQLTGLSIGGCSLYLHKQTFAKKEVEDDQELFEALTEAGYGHLIEPKVNSNQLSALIRSFDTDESGELQLPEPLQGKVSASQKFSVRVRTK